MIHRFKKNNIIAYRIGNPGKYPLYVHPECIDRYFPREGDAIFAKNIVIGEDDLLYFPDEYTGEWNDKTIDNTCCGGCGIWFNDDDRLDGLKESLRGWQKKSRKV